MKSYAALRYSITGVHVLMHLPVMNPADKIWGVFGGVWHYLSRGVFLFLC